MELLTDHFFVPLPRKAVTLFSYLPTFPITYSSSFSLHALFIPANFQIILKKKKRCSAVITGFLQTVFVLSQKQGLNSYYGVAVVEIKVSPVQ